MKLDKLKSMEALFYVLYSHEMAQTEDPREFCSILDQIKFPKSYIFSAFEMANAIISNILAIDAMVTSHVKEYAANRISPVEMTILRIMVHLTLSPECSPECSNDHLKYGILLAKKFGSSGGEHFIIAITNEVHRIHSPNCDIKTIPPDQ